MALPEAGYRANHKRCQRLWREEGLRVTRRARRKRAGTSTGPDVLAGAKNVVWAIDVGVRLHPPNGRPFTIANVIDEHTREASAATSPARSPARTWSLTSPRSPPTGAGPPRSAATTPPELTCAAPADWARGTSTITVIDPGCPWQNPCVESFHSRLRDECLNLNHFTMLLEAKVVIDDWRAEYNAIRPHSALGYRAPTAYPADCTHQHQPEELSQHLDR